MNKAKNNEIYHQCTATELKEELCEKCPLTERIKRGIQEQILPQIRNQKSLLTEEQFIVWVNKEIESASKSMQEARLASIKYKDQAEEFASNWNELYHWNIARIQVLNQACINITDTNHPENLFNFKPNVCQYLYSELTKDGYFMPTSTNQQHFDYVFGGGICPSNFVPLCWNRSKQALSELIVFAVGKNTTSVPRPIKRDADRVFVKNGNKPIGELNNIKRDNYSSDYRSLETIAKVLKSHSS